MASETLRLANPPKGYFWRVLVSSRTDAALQLRRKRTLMPSALVKQGQGRWARLPEGLRSLSRKLLEDLQELTEAFELEGDYHHD